MSTRLGQLPNDVQKNKPPLIPTKILHQGTATSDIPTDPQILDPKWARVILGPRPPWHHLRPRPTTPTMKRARSGSVTNAMTARGKVTKKARIAKAPPANRGFYGPQTRLRHQMQGIEEKKVIDTAAVNHNCDTTGLVSLINGVAQGSDFNNRIGRKVTIKSVQLRGHFTSQDGEVADCYCRLLIVYDRQPNGALPSVTDVLTASTSVSFMNLNNRERFVILAEHSIALADKSSLVAGDQWRGSPTTASVDIYRKVDLPVIFDGTGATIGDIQTGSLFVLSIGDQVTNNAYNCALTTRVRFVDG